MNDRIDLAVAVSTGDRNKLNATGSRSAATGLGRPQHDTGPLHAEPSLGELKAQHRELHLCFRCTHHMVCAMAKALDTNLLVTIATCLAFEPDDADASNDVCELLPIEPLPTT